MQLIQSFESLIKCAVILIFIVIPDCANFTYRKPIKDKPFVSDDNTFTWIGLLRVQEDAERSEAITGLTLIKEQLAVACAKDIGILDKATFRANSKAMFYTDMFVPWFCNVIDFVLHPEYVTNVNTLALIMLDEKRTDIEWKPISWPKGYIDEDSIMYNIGYSDEEKVFQQIKYKMKIVDKDVCEEFYENEELNIDSLVPTYYKCYKTTRNSGECVFEAGTALATKGQVKGIWILSGISILGPGCNLPSRYIEFYPYIPWIESVIDSTDSLASGGARRSFNGTGDQGMFDSFEDRDTDWLVRINKSAMMLKPFDRNKTEVIFGNCTDDDTIIFRDSSRFRATGLWGTGIYALSLFDRRYKNCSCVVINVNAEKRSFPTPTLNLVFEDMGFKQDNIEQFIRTVDIYNREKINHTRSPKVIFIKDQFDRFYDLIITTNLMFRFQFYEEAKLNIAFFAKQSAADKAKKNKSKMIVKGPKDKKQETTTTRNDNTTDISATTESSPENASHSTVQTSKRIYSTYLRTLRRKRYNGDMVPYDAKQNRRM